MCSSHSAHYSFQIYTPNRAAEFDWWISVCVYGGGGMCFRQLCERNRSVAVSVFEEYIVVWDLESYTHFVIYSEVNVDGCVTQMKGPVLQLCLPWEQLHAWVFFRIRSEMSLIQKTAVWSPHNNNNRCVSFSIFTSALILSLTLEWGEAVDIFYCLCNGL